MHIKFSRSDVNKLLDEVLSLMNKQMEDAGIAVYLKSDENTPEIMAWSDGLKQIFMNLMLNARAAMPESGEIRIEVIPRDHSVQIIFQDTGPGIDPKHIPYIFEPFYTTRQEGAGTGLGLSVCHSIVKNHNGTIEFCNNPVGGRFKVELPIEQDKEEYEWRI
jgi:signal transduction histidine kinase